MILLRQWLLWLLAIMLLLLLAYVVVGIGYTCRVVQVQQAQIISHGIIITGVLAIELPKIQIQNEIEDKKKIYISHTTYTHIIGMQITRLVMSDAILQRHKQGVDILKALEFRLINVVNNMARRR